MSNRDQGINECDDAECPVSLTRRLDDVANHPSLDDFHQTLSTCAMSKAFGKGEIRRCPPAIKWWKLKVPRRLTRCRVQPALHTRSRHAFVHHRPPALRPRDLVEPLSTCQRCQWHAGGGRWKSASARSARALRAANAIVKSLKGLPGQVKVNRLPPPFPPHLLDCASRHRAGRRRCRQWRPS